MKPEEIEALGLAIATSVVAGIRPVIEALAPAPVVESPTSNGYELVAESGLPAVARAIVYTAIEAGVPAAEAIESQKTYIAAITAEAAAAVVVTPPAAPLAGRVLEGAKPADDRTWQAVREAAKKKGLLK